MSFRVVMVSLGLLAGVGCGSAVSVEDDDGAGGQGATGGQGASGGAGATGGNGGTGNLGGECSAFEDEASLGEVTFTFRNDSSWDIYVPFDCDVNIPIQPVAGPDGVTYGNPQGCFFSCEDYQTMEDFPACAPCASGAYRLEPGGALEVVWGGTGTTSVEMPDACFANPDLGPSCSKVVAAAPGDYSVVDLIGWSECPGCECNPDGTCYGQVGGIQAYPDPTTFQVPGDDTVEIVFGVCSIPCPG